MSLKVQHVVGIAAGLAALRLVPDKIEIPKHYVTSTLATETLQRFVGSVPPQPAGLTDVTWPFKKLCAATADAVNHVIVRPLTAVSSLIETAARGDFKSSVQMAEKNVKDKQEQNDVYEKRLRELAPVVEFLLSIRDLASKSTDKLATENTQGQASLELRKKELEEITQARQSIDSETTTQALDKITSIIQKILTNPFLIRNLESNVKVLEQSKQHFGAAEESLTQARHILGKKTSRLELLMSECATLSSEEEEIFKLLKSQGVALLEQSKKSQLPTPPLVTYDHPTQVAS